MDALTDTITSAVTPEPIDSLSLWVKPVGEDEEYGDLSLLKLKIYHSDKGTWENIAQLPYYWLNADGGEYSVSGDYIGDDVTQVRLSIIQLGLVTFIVDDVTLHYSKKGTKNFIVKDHHLKGCEYTVTLTWALIETPQKGSTTARVTLPNPNNVDLSNVIVAFMNKSGTPFFVDKVRILQDIKSGEELVVPFTNVKTNETQYTFTGLDESVDHAFSVTG